MRCVLCGVVLQPGDEVNLHHPVYRSEGGTSVEPTHKACHVAFHSRKGDFKAWGKLSSLTRRWAFNLKHVKDNPAYEFDRQYYLMLYAE